MKQSDQIGELVKALAAAQAEIQPPHKGRTATVQTKTGGSYRFNYCDLSDVIAAVRGPLSKHEIAFTFGVGMQDGKAVLEARLMHGEQWLASEYPLNLNGSPQQNGSELTYARRYALCGLLGIASEDDDDGNLASGNTAQVERRQREQKHQTAPVTTGTPSEDEQFLARLDEAFQSKDFDEAGRAAAVRAVCNKHKVRRVTELSAETRKAFIAAIVDGKLSPKSKK